MSYVGSNAQPVSFVTIDNQIVMYGCLRGAGAAAPTIPKIGRAHV